MMDPINSFLQEIVFNSNFSRLKSIGIIGIISGDEFLSQFLQLTKLKLQETPDFFHTLERLEINGTVIQNEETHSILSELILLLPNLKMIHLLGTSIGENLDLYVQCLKKPNIQSLDLQYNGLTANTIAACFKHIVNFDTLVSLNLS